jgi:hypothetical protein
MNTAHIQYVSNEQGIPTAVIVPIEVWQKAANCMRIISRGLHF